MTPLETAQTVLTWGFVPGLALLGIFAANALHQAAEYFKAKTETERRYHASTGGAS